MEPTNGPFLPLVSYSDFIRRPLPPAFSQGSFSLLRDEFHSLRHLPSTTCQPQLKPAPFSLPSAPKTLRCCFCWPTFAPSDTFSGSSKCKPRSDAPSPPAKSSPPRSTPLPPALSPPSFDNVCETSHDRSSGEVNDNADEALIPAPAVDDVGGNSREDNPASPPLVLVRVLPENALSNREPVPQIACPLFGTVPVLPPLTPSPTLPQRLLPLVSASPVKVDTALVAEATFPLPTPLPVAIEPQEGPKMLSRKDSPRPPPVLVGDVRKLVLTSGRGGVAIVAAIAAVVLTATSPPAPGRRCAVPGVPPLADVGGLAGDILVGINTRAAAESSPFATALDMSVAELGEPGKEDVVVGFDGVAIAEATGVCNDAGATDLDGEPTMSGEAAVVVVGTGASGLCR